MIDSTILDDYLKEHFNPEQSQAVQILQNCVVKAGAGSGKTRVLTYRFFYLVATGRAHVDEILTLTFTKAAAAEMYERIQKIFVDHSHDTDMLRELQHFSEATITTLDSFCYQVVQMDLSRFGLTPDFILDPQEADRIASQIALRRLSSHRVSPAMKVISELYSPDGLIDSLIIPLFSRFFWLSMPYDHLKDASAVRETVQKIIRERIEEFRFAADSLWGYADEVETDASGRKNTDALKKAFSLLEENPDEEDIPKAYKLRKKLEITEEYNALVDIYNTLRERKMREITILHSQKEDFIDEMYQFIGELHGEVSEMKRQRQVLSYYDVAQMARHILSCNEQARVALSTSYRYIMVDEFQDTNELQKEILYLLSLREPNHLTIPVAPQALRFDKLFMVGDEKQSIYRFRGADVSVFRRLDRQIIDSGGVVLPLRKNYRSEYSLIQTFNSLFKEILSEAEQEFEASSQDLESKNQEDTVPVHRELFVIEGDGKSDDEEQQEADPDSSELTLVEKEALFLSDLVDTIVHSGEYRIQKDGLEVSPSYDDIAIVMRTYSPQLQYEKYFRMKGIPYVLTDVKSLHLEAVANDIYSMLQLLIHPEDFLAYAAVLRSPLCYIRDDELLLVLEASRQWGIFCDSCRVGLMYDEDKYRSICELYERLQEMSTHESLYALVSTIWNEGGYRHTLLTHESYSVFIEHIEYLMELAVQEERDGGSLVTYTDRLRTIIENSEDIKGLSVLSERSSGVRLMSIHKSKGLQFPVVIVASCGTASRQHTLPGVYQWKLDGREVPVPYHAQTGRKGVNLIWEEEKKKLVEQDEAELKRLFYVACTRAQSHLLFSGVSSRSNTDEKNRNRNFLSMLMSADPEAHGITLTFLDASQFTVQRKTLRHEDLVGRVNQISPWYSEWQENEEVAERIVSVTAGSHTGIEGVDSLFTRQLTSYPSDEILSRYALHGVFGTWVHALFEALLSPLKTTLDPDLSALDVSYALSLKPSALTQSGIQPREEQILAQDIMSMVEQTLNSPFFVSLGGEALKEVESELEFMARVEYDGEDLGVSGIVDLLLRYEDHITIVDFKTDRFQDPELHERQLAIYTSAMRKLYDLKVKSVLCYVRQSGMEWWFE
ncbi:MAG: UvrD-helicase domain-containing protein [Sphaerochaetaceae bacterium]|nr:UvrD-helicase domain-containing protein [Sphaerochaetaceae bacterium]